ncbi:hypothetical protein EVAR_23824_1 [Eumeta japonica]|uniref:Uncharacterized protein n=1 Tax=Eumeta variegata TaxID=151549 RepID=A0A4C1VLG5_EUMVA|nr:hypothetical protein EVAR_23824_1 [Eumeta japonica]
MMLHPPPRLRPAASLSFARTTSEFGIIDAGVAASARRARPLATTTFPISCRTAPPPLVLPILLDFFRNIPHHRYVYNGSPGGRPNRKIKHLERDWLHKLFSTRKRASAVGSGLGRDGRPRTSSHYSFGALALRARSVRLELGRAASWNFFISRMRGDAKSLAVKNGRPHADVAQRLRQPKLIRDALRNVQRVSLALSWMWLRFRFQIMQR